MADIAVNPIVLKDVELTIGGTDNYSAHASSVTFTPSFSNVTWQGLSPDSAFTDTTAVTWTVAIEYAQDWSTSGLSTYFYTNAGTSKSVQFSTKKTQTTGDPIWDTTVYINHGSIGGAVNAVASASVTFACDKPELTRAV